MKKPHLLAAAVAAALGTTAMPASAIVVEFNWSGYFTVLVGADDEYGVEKAGGAVLNTSLYIKGNQTITPISGTITFDTSAGTGYGTVSPFDFSNNAPSQPASVNNLSMTRIGDGFGNPGTLVLGNMLFDWAGNYNIPVSIVLDAAGLFGNLSTMLGAGPTATLSGTGATPAADGTMVKPTVGYINIGASPVATTTFNTTNASGCTFTNCSGVNPSGTLPIVTDTTVNKNKSYFGTVLGIGGSPMQDGPLLDASVNFDITYMHLTAVGSFGGPPPDPIPVAVGGEGVVGAVPGLIAIVAGSKTGLVSSGDLDALGVPVDDVVLASCQGSCFDLDIDISGNIGGVANVYIALKYPLAAGTLALRLFDTGDLDWRPFMADGTFNTLGTTSPDRGVCPTKPEAYTPGLNEGDQCLNVNLNDHGPNDTSISSGAIGLFGGVAILPEDSDGDGVADIKDNCLLVENPDQRDTDNDGFGNICDADFNNDNFVNFTDLAYFKSVFGTADPDGDLDGNGFVNFLDLSVFRKSFGTKPGPGSTEE